MLIWKIKQLPRFPGCGGQFIITELNNTKRYSEDIEKKYKLQRIRNLHLLVGNFV